MMRHWMDEDGGVRLSLGFLVNSTTGEYVGYKVFPSVKSKSRKATVELCKGILRRMYIKSDKYLLLQTKEISKTHFDTDDEARTFAGQELLGRSINSWLFISPAYPFTLLRTKWKNINKIRL